MQRHHPVLGISLSVLAAACFALVYAFYKMSVPHLPNSLVIFFQSLCSWILVAPFMLSHGWKFLFSPHFPLITLRTLLGLISTIFITLALSRITLSETVLLNNAFPIFVPFIASLFFKEKINHSLWPGIILGFIGVFLILRPGFEQTNIGTLFALFSAVFSAGLIAVLRRISHEPFLRLLFYYFFIMWVVLFPFLFTHWEMPPPIVWIYLLCASLTALSAQLFLASALRYATSQEVGPFLYASVIFSAIIDWVVWHNVPGLITLIGMVVVCIGGILTVVFSKKKARAR